MSAVLSTTDFFVLLHWYGPGCFTAPQIHPCFELFFEFFKKKKETTSGRSATISSFCIRTNESSRYFYTCVSLSWLLISVWICIDTRMRTEKHFSPLPQKYSAQWLPALPLRGPFAVTTKLIISPLQQAVFAALQFFLPNAHTSICRNVT